MWKNASKGWERDGGREAGVYVVDEVLGSVDVLSSFDSLGPWPDSHEVKVDGGEVRYVYRVTVM